MQPSAARFALLELPPLSHHTAHRTLHPPTRLAGASVERYQRAGYYLLHRALERPEAQQNGLALLIDFGGFSLGKMVRSVKISDIRRGISMMQAVAPGRSFAVGQLAPPLALLPRVAATRALPRVAATRALSCAHRPPHLPHAPLFTMRHSPFRLMVLPHGKRRIALRRTSTCCTSPTRHFGSSGCSG